MHGHDVTLHVTESGRLVPLCRCGWIGRAHGVEYSARGEHNAHVRDLLVAARNAALPDPALVEKIARIVRRPGRFGSA